MTEAEKTLLIQLLTNIDEIIALLTEEQRKQAKSCINRIYCNYWNLIEGVGGA